MDSRTRAPWRPVLEAEAAARARRTAGDIAAAIACAPGELGYDLADGAAGVALLFGYLARADGDPDHRAHAAALLEHAGDRLAELPTTASLFHGFPGVAWAADHLRGVFGEADLELGDDVDAALRSRLAGPLAHADGFDLVTGLVGVGVYALERRGRPDAERCAELVIARLAELARVEPTGISFWTAPVHLPPQTRAAWPAGYHDFGLAHGVPGVVALLARATALGGAAGATARELLDGSVGWLLAQRGDGDTAFPACAASDGRRSAARSGWCYGDAAVALALVRASSAGDPAWADAGVALARHAAARPIGETGVRDATLCHGAAALAHIYQRLAHATGDPALTAAARAWLARIDDYRVDHPALSASAGFFRATRADPVADRGLLNGAAGIALVLLAACSTIAPDWDRALLLG